MMMMTLDDAAFLAPPLLCPPSVLQRAAGIQLLAMDVDGVLTPSTIVWNDLGEAAGLQEAKTFNVKDGYALRKVKRAGMVTAIITGRASRIVAHRGAELDIAEVHQAVRDKTEVLAQLCQQYQLQPSQVAYMGDDEPDVGVLRLVGLATAPADAVPGVRAACHWVSQHGGGQGAMRELCDLLLYARSL